MGITSAAASFRGHAPTLEAIVSKVEELSGLALLVESRPPGTMFRFHANVAFACVRRERLDVFTYAPSATSVRDQIVATPGIEELARDNPRVADMVDRLRSESPPDPNVTHVHTRGYVSEEGTFHDFVLMALESLGGVLTRPMSDNRRARCSTPLTAAVLRARHRQHARLWMPELLKAPIRLLTSWWHSAGGR